jgi:hypothetical protein
MPYETLSAIRSTACPYIKKVNRHLALLAAFVKQYFENSMAIKQNKAHDTLLK